MRSQWQQWPDEARKSWRVPGGTAYVVFPMFGGDTVQHDDGTWSPKEFTYVEIPNDAARPYFVVECEHTDRDLVPRVMAVHVIQSEADREVRTTDLRRLRLEDAIEEAWRRASRRPATVRDDATTPIEMLTPAEEEQHQKRTARGLRNRARRRITDSVLDEVAEIYRTNQASGRPTQAVGDHFGLAQSTASLYVKRARDAGRDMGEATRATHAPPSRRRRK